MTLSQGLGQKHLFSQFWLLANITHFIHPGQGHGGSGACPWNTMPDAPTHSHKGAI